MYHKQQTPYAELYQLTPLLDEFPPHKQRSQDILESLSTGVAALTPEGMVLEINQACLEQAQERREGVVGKPLVETLWRFSAPRSQRQLQGAIAQASKGETVRFESRMHRRKGRYTDLDVTVTPHCNTSKQIEYLIYTSVDITTHKQAEEELCVLAESIPQLVWITRPDGFVEYFNQRWHDYTGLTSEQTQGDGWSQSLHPDDQQRTIAIWHAAAHAGTSYGIEYRVRNGTTGEYRWFLARGVPLKDAQGKIIKWVGTCTDIHENKQRESVLRVSETRFKTLFHSNLVGIGVIDAQGKVIEANEFFRDMVGYTKEEVLAGRMHMDSIKVPEFDTLNQHMLKELLETGTTCLCEQVYLRKDGSRVPVVVGATMLEGSRDLHIGFVLDITERKELEQRKDEFISIASHELKTPLTALKLLLSRLRRKLQKEGSTETETDLVRMEGQIEAVTRLLHDLLDVSKIQLGRFDYDDELIDLDMMIREVTETFQQTTATHALRVHGALDKPLVGDRNRLEQVLNNLISNAIKYSPQADTVDIFLRSSNETALISVQDYGVGIPKEQQSNIFERFNRGVYTRREKAFPGLGMGLYIANEIIRHYGGDIAIQSEEGKGTIFSVSLPLHCG